MGVCNDHKNDLETIKHISNNVVVYLEGFL